jgi:adenylylsulfate reductase subunit A
VGGHAASGFWVDTNRETTVKGLFAAGDAAGGCPQKYVTGAFAEGEIAAKSALKYINNENAVISNEEAGRVKQCLQRILNGSSEYRTDDLEEEMQEVMDKYAGGIGQHYRYDEKSLAIAAEEVQTIGEKSEKLSAKTMRELLYIFELRERLILCRSVIAHLAARKETRWRSFGENTDYPERRSEYDVYINSKFESGVVKVFTRSLIKESGVYEH